MKYVPAGYADNINQMSDIFERLKLFCLETLIFSR